MGLFYEEEHRTCYHYSTPELHVFKTFDIKKGKDSFSEDVSRSIIVFVLNGKINITCNSFQNNVVKTGEMVLLPKNCCCYGDVLENSRIIACAFIQDIQFCNKYSLENLSNDVSQEVVYDFTILPIHERLLEFLELLRKCLNDGLGCTHFHNWKKQELFILLRAYYEKSDLASFFYPVIGKNLDFKDFVLTNYTRINDIKDFASLANLTPITFNRRFKEAFNQPAHKWIAARKAERVLRDIKITNKTFEEITTEHNFSSPAYLATFCKQHYGKSPTELRSQELTKCNDFKSD